MTTELVVSDVADGVGAFCNLNPLCAVGKEAVKTGEEAVDTAVQGAFQEGVAWLVQGIFNFATGSMEMIWDLIAETTTPVTSADYVYKGLPPVWLTLGVCSDQAASAAV